MTRLDPQQRILVAGLGNIGSHLAVLLLRAGAERLLLVDRDVVEEKNLLAQDYQPCEVGQPKAMMLGNRLRASFPNCEITALACDLKDLPQNLGEVHLIAGCLDSRLARQLLVSDLAWPRGVPVVDGGVGDGLGRVQVFVPSEETACLECTWGQADYRLLAAEYPCIPGARPQGVPTGAPAHVGAFVASLMANEIVRLMATESAKESYEIAVDLGHLVMRRFTLKRSPRCRFSHAR